MQYLRKLPGFQRSPAGLEWRIWKRLPWIFLAGTTLPLLACALAYGMSQLEPSAAGDRAVEQFFYAMAGTVLLHWTLWATLAIGCVIVMIMKGPAYVADGYSQPPSSDRPQAR